MMVISFLAGVAPDLLTQIFHRRQQANASLTVGLILVEDVLQSK
ncbi:hypothetical protein [Dapis sp. BLCC M172]